MKQAPLLDLTHKNNNIVNTNTLKKYNDIINNINFKNTHFTLVERCSNPLPLSMDLCGLGSGMGTLKWHKILTIIVHFDLTFKNFTHNHLRRLP